MRPAVAVVALAFTLCLSAAAWSASHSARSVQVGTQERMLLPQPITRVSVADPAVVDLQILNARELLVLGRRVGRTNVILWFEDGSVEDGLWAVHRDLSLLNSVLRDIHPDVHAESAPDRDAVVLRGQVPNVRFSRAAEGAARSYLVGGTSRAGGGVVVQVPDAPGSDAAAAAETEVEAEHDPSTEPAVRSEGNRATAGGVRVLNLIRVEELPQTLEERILSAIRPIGGKEVRVRRITRGDAPDDRTDSFVFEGHVQDQVALVRVLITATRVLRGSGASADIQTIADEAGSLRAGGGGGGGSVASVISSAGARSGGGRGRSSVRSNPARAPALSAAGGRILSFVEVRDLPQVRIEARIYEVSRSRLRDWDPSASLLLGDFSQGPLLPSPLATLVQGEEAANIGAGGSTVQNVLSLLGGGLFDSFQVQSGIVAFDLLFSLLEEEGISRSLATPSLTVLSGESAELNVGGQIPITTTIETETSAASGTLFSTTVFADFGVSLSVVPRVGGDDFITLDVAPSISAPDLTLTSAVSDATGETQATTAFETRSLSTSTRLRDGHALVLAGLLQQSSAESAQFTPWLHQVPGLGWLARSQGLQRDDLELVIAISPNIVRDPLPRAGLWEFANAAELLREDGEGTRASGPAHP